MKARIGDLIRIDFMSGEPQYRGREGVVTHIDAANQIHGTWGSCAIIPEEDDFTVLKRSDENGN